MECLITEEFRQGTIQVAEILDLDEIESAKLYSRAIDDAGKSDRSPLIVAIVYFHEKRQFLLESLRLLLQESLRSFEDISKGDELSGGLDGGSDNADDEVSTFQELRDKVLEVLQIGPHGAPANGSNFLRKCVESMLEIEVWLNRLGEQMQTASVLGQVQGAEAGEIIEYQQTSLSRQHESLGAVVCYLIKGTYSTAEDFKILIERLRKIERFDILLIHYVPALLACIEQYGSADGTIDSREAEALHKKITGGNDTDMWALASFRAATRTWWLAEYSGRSFDQSAIAGTDSEHEAEAEERSGIFMQALKDRAFEFTLSICAGLTPHDWHDPTRPEMLRRLVKDIPLLQPDSFLVSDYFQPLIMEHLEGFVDAFISNMPDTVRKLKSEEDNRRAVTQKAFKEGMVEATMDEPFYLESFLLVTSFAFEHREEAARSFWADTEDNLYGFLQWASKRQSVPRVSAFCEMLCAISEGEENSNSAHQFLLEEGRAGSARFRRTTSMNWAQILAELQIYSARVVEQPNSQPTGASANPGLAADKLSEPESDEMLGCYLRLIAHLCQENAVARAWLLSHSTYHVVNMLFTLCSGRIPARLRAAIFLTLQSFLTDKMTKVGEDIWIALDSWVSGQSMNNGPKPSIQPGNRAWTEQMIFASLAEDFDQSNAFVALLHSLLVPSVDQTGLYDSLPFPESLGGSYRMPGVEPFIDFALGTVFATLSLEMQEDARVSLIRCNCLNVVIASLTTFNENLFVVANRSSIPVDTIMKSTSLASYAQFHPFARTMEWLFNTRVLDALFLTAHQDVAEVGKARPESPMVAALLRSIDVMNLIMDLQPTYLALVRPLVKRNATNSRGNVFSTSLASFEDSVLNNLQLIVDLGLYCGTGHQQLILSSLALLEKLSSSRKLNFTPASRTGRWQNPKMLEMLQADTEADSIKRSFATEMEVNVREFEAGREAPGYATKSSILAFVNKNLGSTSGKPTIAHILLGFFSSGNSLDLSNGGSLASGTSLFHSIICLLQEYPNGDEGFMVSWLLAIRRASMEALRHLWSSTLTSSFTLECLRRNDFLSNQSLKQSAIGNGTLWDGNLVGAPEFLLEDSANGLVHFLYLRAYLFQYASSEIRMASQDGSLSLKDGIFSTLMGTTSFPDGENVPNPTIFDLFDFSDIDFGNELEEPPLVHMAGIDLQGCLVTEADTTITYDLRHVEELVLLAKTDILNRSQANEQVQHQIDEEAQSLLAFILATNQRRRILAARLIALRSWADLIVLTAEACGSDSAVKVSFILQTLQLVLPKLDRFIGENDADAMEMAKLSESLVASLDLDTTAVTTHVRFGDAVDDRLFQLFRTCLRGIHNPLATSTLREVLYHISSQYFVRMATNKPTDKGMKFDLDALGSDHASSLLKSTGSSRKALTATKFSPAFRRQTMQAVHTAGERLINVACDDAYAGEESCRIPAILFLECLVSLSQQEKSPLVLKAFNRFNFLGLLIDGIRSIQADLENASAKGESQEYSIQGHWLTIKRSIASAITSHCEAVLTYACCTE